MKILIRQIRVRKGICLTELSKISGVARGYLYELENGKYSNPSLEILCKLSKSLNCSIDDLVSCED